MTKRFSTFIYVFLMGGLIACTPPETLRGPGGTVNISSLPIGFDVTNLPSGWILVGNAGSAQISPSTVDPIHELSVTSSDEEFSLTRITDAGILTTPYLSWRWNLAPGNWRYHPLRLLIGFNGGSPYPAKPKGFARLFSLQNPPPHDRGLSIVWGPSALMRGTLTHIQARESKLTKVQYTIRGGQESAGQWKTETIDISDLYARAWPDDDASKAHVVFIGIGVTKTQAPHTAIIGDIRLSR